MKRKLLKDFGGKAQGQMIDVDNDARANYLQRVGVIGGAEKPAEEEKPATRKATTKKKK